MSHAEELQEIADEICSLVPRLQKTTVVEWSEVLKATQRSWNSDDLTTHRRLRIPASEWARLQKSLSLVTDKSSYEAFMPPLVLGYLSSEDLQDGKLTETLERFISLWTKVQNQFANESNAQVLLIEFNNSLANAGWKNWLDPNDISPSVNKDIVELPGLDPSALAMVNSLLSFISFEEAVTLLAGVWSGSLVQPRSQIDWESAESWILGARTIESEDDLYKARAWTISNKSPFLDVENQEKILDFLSWAYTRASQWETFNSIDPSIHKKLREESDSGAISEDSLFQDWVKVAVPNRRMPEQQIVRNRNVIANNPAAVLEKIDALVGLSELKQEMKNIASFVAMQQERARQGAAAQLPELNLVFTGNPGTGKTTVARLYAQLLRSLQILPTADLIEVSRADLVGAFLGQSEEKTQKVIERAKGGVLFIDEAYAIIQDERDRYGQAVVAQLLLAAENHRNELAIIMAGYPAEMNKFLDSNPGFRSRFRDAINFPNMHDASLFAALQSMATEAGYSISDEAEVDIRAYIARMPRSYTFGNVREMRKILNIMKLNLAQRFNENPAIDVNQFIKEDVPKLHSGRISEVEFNAATAKLDALIGLSPVKEKIKTLANQARLAVLNEEAGNEVEKFIVGHMVFTGNPGTGKTTVAGLMGKILGSIGALPGTNFVSTNRAGLVGQYVGRTGPKVRDVVGSALDGVLFIDEAYALFNEHGNDFGHEAIATLLELMETYRDRLVVIFAGYKEDIEVFLESNQGLKSRIIHHIDFPDFSLAELKDIVKFETQKSRIQITDAAVNLIAESVDSQRSQRAFANARSIRNLVDLAIQNRSNRIMSMPAEKRDLQAPIDTVDVPDAGSTPRIFGFA
jgi:SpoVK/Ycf46/Vps4 family AAA+-type ATPase